MQVSTGLSTFQASQGWNDAPFLNPWQDAMSLDCQGNGMRINRPETLWQVVTGRVEKKVSGCEAAT
jgi:hypothetical protein